MNPQVSVALLFIFLTGGHSLKCYVCKFDLMTGSCDGKPMTCPSGASKCASITADQSIGSTKVSLTTKLCTDHCEPGTQQLPTGTISTKCCDTDLCNGTDGIYKGSFLLLLLPLFFYILLH
ncbi:three-finger toxin MALT0070C [Myxocyprinus asiaticus]|uniref:three-finger toxin MALT0070C n=1 Tax=Myxocyprinus asiaticus TaxID=70543 RepID=UPI002222FF18|nr:three-finger toxin MALT0070C [Myxocyprinus asiaticus]